MTRDATSGDDLPPDPGWSDELVVGLTRDVFGPEVAALVAELLTIGTSRDRGPAAAGG